MNHFYLSKKSCYVSGVLNIVGSVAILLMIGVISYYHFGVLANGSGSAYAYLLTTNSSTTITSPLWAKSYISAHGFKNFFQGVVFGNLTYWHIIRFFSVISMICFSTKTILCIGNLISAIKAKSVAFIHASLLDLCFPLVGGIIALTICRDNKKMVEYKSIMPMQLVRTKIKNICAQIFSDVNMKNL